MTSCVVVANVLDCHIVVSNFELHLRYQAHFRNNTVGIGMNPFNLSYIVKIVPQLFFYTDDFGIKLRTKNDISLKKKPNITLLTSDLRLQLSNDLYLYQHLSLSLYIYIYIYIYISFEDSVSICNHATESLIILQSSSWGARGVMAIVVENEHDDTSSNTRRDWFHFA